MLKASFGGEKTARAFGDYQFYLSYGGDQLFNLPFAVDSNFGVSGQISQVSNSFFTIPCQLAGYAAYGKLSKLQMSCTILK